MCYFGKLYILRSLDLEKKKFFSRYVYIKKSPFKRPGKYMKLSIFHLEIHPIIWKKN